jgi:SWI/SNF-related matrix-associated actin-dependent regulator of chromatin subfamily A3
MAPPKRAAEAIDLTDDTSTRGRAPKQQRTAYNSTQSGASQQDAVYIDDDDEEEDMSATQGMSEQLYSWTLYGTMHGKIVGVRYYTGYATEGEMVVVRREPHNAYDSNAIQVLNVQGTQIGHIPKTVAAKLAKYMDNRSLLIEAQITGPKGAFDCPIELKFYGTNEPVERENLVTQMRADKLPVGHAADRKRKEAAAAKEREKIAKEAAKRAKKKGGAVVEVGGGETHENGMADFMAGSSQAGSGSALSLEDIVGGSERYNPRNIEQVVEEFGVKEKDLVGFSSFMPNVLLLTMCRPPCSRQTSQAPYLLNSIPSSYKAYIGCLRESHPSLQLKAPKTWFSCGSVIHACQMPSQIWRQTFPSPTQHWPREAYSQTIWV